MKRLALMTVVLLLLSSTAFAIGMGPFLDISGGSGEVEVDDYYYDYSWDVDTSTGAIGFVLDTAPTNESTFNYRLNVGIANQVMEGDFGDDFDSTGIYVENTFGFAFVKNDNFRWWAGPLIRLGFYSGEVDNSNIDIDYAEFGVGAVTGWNFRAGQTILSPSIGFRFNGFAGTWEDGYYEDDIEGNSTTAFANVALLF